VERAKPKGVVVRDRDPLMGRYGSFEDDVTADLVHLRVLPSPAQGIREMRARDVARDLHATEKISSRTRWRRIRSGRGRSKKYAAVASITFLRSSSQVSASVKMLSVRHSAQ